MDQDKSIKFKIKKTLTSIYEMVDQLSTEVDSQHLVEMSEYLKEQQADLAKRSATIQQAEKVLSRVDEMIAKIDEKIGRLTVEMEKYPRTNEGFNERDIYAGMIGFLSYLRMMLQYTDAPEKK